MKIAISGKGGVGKTTFASFLIKAFAEQGKKVLAIDADPDANLAQALGIEGSSDIVPISEMKALIEERTEAKVGSMGSFFKLNPKVDDLPDAYSISLHGVKLLILGAVPKAGGGCFCPEGVLLKSLIHYLLVRRDEVVILDMEAGLEHLSRGSTKEVDAFIVVVEPGQRSIATALQIKRMAEDLGVERVYGVGNKVSSEEDRRLIEEGLKGIEILGHISLNEKVIEADKRGLSPYDLDGRIREEVKGIIGTLKGRHGI